MREQKFDMPTVLGQLSVPGDNAAETSAQDYVPCNDSSGYLHLQKRQR